MRGSPGSPRRARRSAGGRCRCGGRSAACGRCPAGAGPWRGGRSSRSGSRRPCTTTRRSRRSVTPPLMPPPASQEVNVNGLWSRPLPPWLHGIRPNSVVQMTIVSSSRPRAFRSLSSAAAGRSMLAAHVAVVAGDVLVGVPVAAREAVVGAAPDLHEPHAALQQPPGDQAVAAEVRGDRLVQAVELLRRRRSRRDRSSTSGALSCSRAASS